MSPRTPWLKAVGFFCFGLLLLSSARAAGPSWTLPHQTPGGASLWGVAAGPTSAVAVGTGGKILLSTDGVQWTEQNSGTAEWLLGVAFGQGKFIAVGDHGTILQSVDGKTWTPVSSVSTTARLNNIAFGDDHFIAVGEAGTIIISSTTGWQVVPSGFSGWLRGIARGREAWVVTGQGGTALGSTTGLTWTAANTATSSDLEAAVYSNTLVHYEGGTGGLTLPLNAPPRFPSEDLFGICGEGGLLEMGRATLSEDSTISNHRSPANFWAHPRFASGRLRAAVSVAGVLVLAGDNGSVYQTLYIGGGDRFNFEAVPLGSTAAFNAGAAFGDSIILVGADETIARASGIYRSRLSNVSTRLFVGSGEAASITGLVVNGGRRVMVRAIGPSLKQFGIAHPLPHPVLTAYDAAGKTYLYPPAEYYQADYLRGARMKLYAAYSYSNPDDAAIYLSMGAGAYTIRVTDAENATGVVLLEIFEDPDDGGPPLYGNLRSRAFDPRIVNLSTRGVVGANENTLIGGFIITGDTPREVLIRAAGPALANFGIENPATAPSLTLFRGDGTVLATNSSWGGTTVASGKTVTAADIRAANTIAGAFPFSEGSHDAALLVTLPPGNYTAHVTDPSSQQKIALLEIYEVKR